jgi:hypothetical protein
MKCVKIKKRIRLKGRMKTAEEIKIWKGWERNTGEKRD